MKKTTSKNTYETVTPTIVGESIQTSLPQPDQLASYHYFSSAIYMIEKPQFLASAKKVSEKFLKERKKTQPTVDPMYPLYQTDNMFLDPELADLSTYILQSSWNILKEQGHSMDFLNTYFSEMWCQEHHKYSNHEEHVHPNGAQIVGFYFLDCPKDSSRIVIHDPRPGRKQINLPEQNMSDATYASTMINFQPTPGQLFFANSWLPHSYTRNASKFPIKFIHFTVGVMPAVNTNTPQESPTIV
jgi:uncharacterized protein (TIGR02466 family)